MADKTVQTDAETTVSVERKNSGQGLTIWCLARILQVMVAAGSCFTARAIRRDAILFSGPGRTDQANR